MAMVRWQQFDCVSQIRQHAVSASRSVRATITCPASGVWKKTFWATGFAVSMAALTGMQRRDNTLIADTQQEITPFGLPSP